MNRKKIILLLIILLLVAPLAAPASAAISADTYDLSWYVFGCGGGTVTTNGYALSGTIGQPITGLVETGNYEACSGFWCGAQNFITNVFLPFLSKQ